MRNSREILAAHGGEFSGTLESVPEHVFDVIRGGITPLCAQVTRGSVPARFAFVNNSSLISSAWETSDGPVVVMSSSIPARIYQFIRLTTLFDGHHPVMTYRNPELREHFDEYSDPAPPLLRTAVDDFEDDSEFWETFARNDAEIDRLYEERGRQPLDSLWQTAALATQLVAAHEFAHLREHHHCFIEHIAMIDEEVPSQSQVLRSLELQADDFAADILANSLYALNEGRDRDLATPFYGLLSYGSSALFHLMDTRRTVLGGSYDKEAHAPALVRSIFVRDSACRVVRELNPDLASQWILASERMYRELESNLGCLIEVLVSRGEMSFAGALRHPGLNPFINRTRVFAAHGQSRLLHAVNEMYADWNQVRKLLFEFLKTHRCDG